ncbi:hypothetical protein D8682_26505 [Buttiauxella sp. 3AFRM03]|uniref:hypothetical protein n=1 Tax=Buttiauxella sp. 3AFRM03 TaxID=2479367 RepID=UPI000EF81BF0|nr:hypothetical protein [Buttiauxella sp. 3AFRM03]AYN25725.1 hypothetical protein D8682_01230 [Buttiauxella sp. 3AFRM03]AYN30218.1 hypothetical protein D8682_26505 [Buttiauxella sp. 3AFRM03]
MTVKRYNAGCAYAGEEEMTQVDDGSYVSYEDYAALLKERDALEVLNDALVVDCDELKKTGKALIDEACHVYRRYNKTQLPDGDIVDEQTIHELSNAINTTFATDAAIANIQAQGVDRLADHLSGLNVMASETSVREFASQLRKETGNE